MCRFFHHKGHTYVVIVDRYSGWPIVERSINGAAGLITTLRTTFVTFGIPDDITTDGGLEFTATTTKKFFSDWGVHHRLCSVANPHSNSRAEIGVKTVKRALEGNTPANGNLDCDSFQRAMLAYRNTPDPITKISPAIAVFARPIKELLPVLPGKLNLHTYWDKLLDARETTMAARGATELAKWSQHTRALPPLRIGDHVRIQNQTGPAPRRWDKTGIVTEVKQFDQYWIKLSGSGRATLRNRKFLRKFAAPPDTQPPPIPPPDPRPSPTEPDTDPTSWDSLPPTPRQIPLDTQPDQPAESSPTPDRPSTPALRRSTRECVTNHRPNYKD